MDPDSGPKNTNIINFVPESLDKERVYFVETNGEKCFSIAYLNDCSHSLVTCRANFDNNYNLSSCYIDVILLDNDYQNISEHDKELTLNDLFNLSNNFNDNERLYLSFDGENVSTYMLGKTYKKETNVNWVACYALKEEEFKYMDICDKMIDYLCTNLNKTKLHRSATPFKRVETVLKMKMANPKILMKKAM